MADVGTQATASLPPNLHSLCGFRDYRQSSSRTRCQQMPISCRMHGSSPSPTKLKSSRYVRTQRGEVEPRPPPRPHGAASAGDTASEASSESSSTANQASAVSLPSLRRELIFHL